jgi:hypothetical protein
LQVARREIAVLATIFVVAGGIWAFISLADEVREGDTVDFDRAVILALRNPADLSDPSAALAGGSCPRRDGAGRQTSCWALSPSR